MSKATDEQLMQLISKAALDPEFREQLLSNPKAAAATCDIKLDDQDVATLQTVTEDLQRFGSTADDLNPVDADSWAIGIMHIRTIRTH